MGNNNEKIDFVITWLDGTDKQWIAQKDEAYTKFSISHKTDNDANSACRYRDMDLLQYWFRGVEKFAPWVNKIYFVTCGQKPEWLNENHPKLVFVDHKDYIPSEYLPTFNSIPIELNLHRIHSLSEHFVLFNDDMFLIKPVTPEHFFKNGDPVIPNNLNICRFYRNDIWSRICINDYCTVNEHFDIKKSIWDNRKKWFSISALGVKEACMNFFRYKLNKTLSINGYEHLAYPHLKSTMQEVWNECPDIMEETSKFRFRSDAQVNHWLMMAWNLAKGRFYPIKDGKRGKLVHVSSGTLETILNLIFRLCLCLSIKNDKNREGTIKVSG